MAAWVNSRPHRLILIKRKQTRQCFSAKKLFSAFCKLCYFTYQLSCCYRSAAFHSLDGVDEFLRVDWRRVDHLLDVLAVAVRVRRRHVHEHLELREPLADAHHAPHAQQVHLDGQPDGRAAAQRSAIISVGTISDYNRRLVETSFNQAPDCALLTIDQRQKKNVEVNDVDGGNRIKNGFP